MRSNSSASNVQSKLVEVGFGGLVQLFLQMSEDGMGRMFEPEQLLQTGEIDASIMILIPGPPIPPNFFPPLPTLQPLVDRIDKILSPSQATPKTDSVARPVFADAMKDFAAMRGDWMKRSLGGLVSRIEEVDEGGIWEGGRGREKVRGLVDLWEVMIVILEVSLLTLDIPEIAADARRRLCSSRLCSLPVRRQISSPQPCHIHSTL